MDLAPFAPALNRPCPRHENRSAQRLRRSAGQGVEPSVSRLLAHGQEQSCPHMHRMACKGSRVPRAFLEKVVRAYRSVSSCPPLATVPWTRYVVDSTDAAQALFDRIILPVNL